MNIDIFELVLGSLIALLTWAAGVIWAKAERAEKTAQANATTLAHLEKQLDKTTELTERLSSLEASFHAEIKNLSVSIKRMESAILRMDQRQK